MEFGENYFIIYNKASVDVIAFRGIYSFAQEPVYAIKMVYEEYLNAEGDWCSLKSTELEGYTDIILFRINGTVLETKVLGNGQKYNYRKIEDPLNNR